MDISLEDYSGRKNIMSFRQLVAGDIFLLFIERVSYKKGLNSEFRWIIAIMINIDRNDEDKIKIQIVKCDDSTGLKPGEKMYLSSKKILSDISSGGIVSKQKRYIYRRFIKLTKKEFMMYEL